MNEMTFDLKGLDELQTDLTKALNYYPDETRRAIMRLSRKFIKDVQTKEPSYDKVLQNKKWKKEYDMDFAGGNLSVDIRNIHPLHHLLENGHHKWLWGKNSGGWVPGKHYTEKTRQEWENGGKVAEELNKICNIVFKKVNL